MMAPLISDNEQPPTVSNQSSPDHVPKKKRFSPSSSRINAASVSTGDGESHARWRSERQQRKYSAKLIRALKQVSSSSSASSSSSPTPRKRGKAVREAADRALAVSARGRTLWSRAILASRIKLKFRKHKRPPRQTVRIKLAKGSRSRGRGRKRRVSVVRLSKKSLPTVNRKLSVLGRLVPGCEKESVPVILEEATDYIQALEMQVRAMNSLVELLSRSGSAPPPI